MILRQQCPNYRQAGFLLNVFPGEHTVGAGCLSFVLSRLQKLAWNIVFRLAFAGFIVAEVVVWVLLLGGVSKLFSEDNFVVGGILVTLAFIGVFAIGALSYFIFQRMTRAGYVLDESEKWLALRTWDQRRVRRRKTLHRWAPWIPTLAVVLLCIFMDYTWAFTSHLFHPDCGRLTGYEVSIPFTWSIAYSDIRRRDGTFSTIVAERYRGLIKAGSGLYVGHGRPPFSYSNMSFQSVPGGDERFTRPGAKVIAVQTVPLGTDNITCWEEVPPRWMTSGRYIRCSTPTGNFSAGFSGANEDVGDFYRVLGTVKRRN